MRASTVGTTRRITRKSKPLSYWLSLMTLMSVLLIFAACSPNRALTGKLPIDAPALANAGEQIDVTVGPVPNASNGTAVGLVMLGTYGPRVYQGQFEAGLAHFTIPSEHTLQPGYLALIAAADQARGEASIILFIENSTKISFPHTISGGSEMISSLSTEQP